MVEQYDNATFNTKVKIARARAPLLAELAAKDAEIAALKAEVKELEVVSEILEDFSLRLQRLNIENTAKDKRIAELETDLVDGLKNISDSRNADIQRLQAENKALREALKKCYDAIDEFGKEPMSMPSSDYVTHLLMQSGNAARALLKAPDAKEQG